MENTVRDISADKIIFQNQDRKLILAHLGFAFFAFLIGVIAGLLQALQRTGYIDLPNNIGYYQLLTAHGVSLALIFTTFFIIGFLYSGLAKTLDGKLMPAANRIAWIGYYMMVIGTLLSLYVIITNDASVLYTFYAPMQASPIFYIGLALVVVGSWLSGVAVFMNYYQWRKRHPGEASPLFAYMAVATMVLWLICTVGVAIEVVFQLIPWSLGWVDKINVELSRTFFWYFGHPLVYFWLLPAYIYWYVLIPKIVGGKIFSNSLPRLTFILFILYSVPVGFHHQLMEPGVSSFWKFLQVVLTMIVVIPSLMTAFAILATFEIAGRKKGATGLFGWFGKLPWKDVRFTATFLGMVIFIPAGAGGVVNTSFQLNQVVHNTLFITGHFHITVAAAVILTFFAIAYWLVPAMRNRQLTPFANQLGLIQCWVWTIGMLIMSTSMHIVGVLGEPRRTAFTTYSGHPAAQVWEPYRFFTGAGSVLLFISAVLFLVNIVYLWFFSPKAESAVDYPIGEVEEDQPKPPAILERWTVWIGITIALVLIAYTVPVMHMFQHAPGSPPIRSW
ncbi:b(o/a)3-type cytochrome-c oxidase subunit 1 [Bacillus benzoevorans]|uniref:Cytochrome c oxidase subunit 1 n=1 Tax=Bacillus benzoevorans TaxID=1456 RepID=A0A7X0LUA3_9BACI|nr:b(o/a)3-type cytochrome-c oxidase subunit 1 [Bacillus benzoevorans]MBB6444235.1 cytochrome c oxidase subunit 1 [Bacillus benzoevorans]